MVMRDVEITKEPVELYKILKFEGVVSSGGQAKAVIDDGQVSAQHSAQRKVVIAKFVAERLKAEGAISNRGIVIAASFLRLRGCENFE
jgi:ribosome-associated protein